MKAKMKALGLLNKSRNPGDPAQELRSSILIRKESGGIKEAYKLIHPKFLDHSYDFLEK